MIHRLEIGLKKGVRDPRGQRVRDGAGSFLGIGIEEVSTRSVFKIKADIGRAEASKVLSEFIDPVIEEGSLSTLPAEGFDWVVTVGFRPGVTDNVGRSALASVSDVLNRHALEGEAVFTETEYFMKGRLSGDEAREVGTKLIANELIERVSVVPFSEWKRRGPDLDVPEVAEGPPPPVREMDLEVPDAELERISSAGVLSLGLDEMKAIRDHYRTSGKSAARTGRGLAPKPTDVELECIAQTWSEHCKHKIFNAVIDYEDENGKVERIESLFDTYIRRSTKEIGGRKGWLVSVFHDNAGVVRFNDSLNLVYKVETHNSPSALDPYGGAMTGIVGVNRDPFGTGRGAALLINVWGYCLGSPFYKGGLPEGLLHPRRIRDGVHKGVIDGGNQSGIPYGLGWECFDDRFIGKPLVFCGTVGAAPLKINGEPFEKKRAKPGDAIVMVGGRIGKDGIHGATFSSEELRSESPSHAVQIGDPITQKKMTDFLLEARDLGLFTCITDNGAGGLSSSVGEMSRLTGGARIDVGLAPLKYAGLAPWEILLSEAQERMTVGVPPDRIEAFMDLSARRDVESTVIGEFTDSGAFEVLHGGKHVAYLDLEFLHDGLPRMCLKARWNPPSPPDPPGRKGRDLSKALLMLLGRLNICSKEKKSRQYDHEVKGLSAVKPFVGLQCDVPSDAAVFLADYASREGIVLAYGVNPSFSDVDTYRMMASVIDEGIRKVVSVGGDPDRIAGLDNFCWPDPVQSGKTPDGLYKLAQLVRANKALYDFTTAFGVPCISGKDSMKNDSTRGGRKISIPPTVLFSTLGRIEDVSKAVTMDFKKAGDVVYAAGITRDELGGSEYYRMLAEDASRPDAVGSTAPSVDAPSAMKLYAAVHKAIMAGLVRSCHSPAKGGLAAALALAAAGGRLGCEIELDAAPAEGRMETDSILFSESNSRFVLTVAPENAAKFEKTLKGLPIGRLGRVAGARIVIMRGGKRVCEAGVAEAVESFKRTLADV